MRVSLSLLSSTVDRVPGWMLAAGLLLLTANVQTLQAQTALPPFASAPQLDRLIEEAIQAGAMPGAVLVVGHNGRVVYEKAYGNRALQPAKTPMTLDTIFDAASLTKVVATTSCVMKLWEQGRIRLNDPVTAYLPEFQGGRSPITVRQLLTHFSGLRADVDLKPLWSGYETGIKLAMVDKPVAPAGTRFIYSDINFILLGEMVRRVSGKPLPDYFLETIAAPTGMKDSRYQPRTQEMARIAPTEVVDYETDVPRGTILRGVVHDETTRYMGGIAGHAGLFSTAQDLARFAQMLLDGGMAQGQQVLAPGTVAKMTTPQSPPSQRVLRGLGWDIDSPYSSVRGELFPIGSYGHTGFTGTSLWIDPASKTYVVLMTNRVHPTRRANGIVALRSKLATAVAAVVMDSKVSRAPMSLTSYHELVVNVPPTRGEVARNGAVKLGLDVLADRQFDLLQGQRVGLITNHTGLDSKLRRNVDVMRGAGVNVVALFSPEHGIAGKRDDEQIGDSKDERTGVPIYSLYSGPNRTPSPEQLQQLDTVVFDIQDIGARFYTYMCTMANSMEAAAKLGKRFVVLDRPNPITGTHIEGPMLDDDAQSFVGCAPIPLRHGLTMGEMAGYVKDLRKLDLKLDVVKMSGWARGDWFDSTGLPWTDPSPNMRSLEAALLYPGVAMWEYAKNLSVGRGTEAPFEWIGADWINGVELAQYLNARAIPGLRTYPVRFTPQSSYFAKQEIQGVRFVITDRDSFHATRLGVELGAAFTKLYPGKVVLEGNLKLVGSKKLIEKIKAGADPRDLIQEMEEDVKAFAERTRPYRLY